MGFSDYCCSRCTRNIEISKTAILFFVSIYLKQNPTSNLQVYCLHTFRATVETNTRPMKPVNLSCHFCQYAKAYCYIEFKISKGMLILIYIQAYILSNIFIIGKIRIMIDCSTHWRIMSETSHRSSIIKHVTPGGGGRTCLPKSNFSAKISHRFTRGNPLRCSLAPLWKQF